MLSWKCVVAEKEEEKERRYKNIVQYFCLVVQLEECLFESFAKDWISALVVALLDTIARICATFALEVRS